MKGTEAKKMLRKKAGDGVSLEGENMERLKKGDRVGIVACSNPLEDAKRERINRMIQLLSGIGIDAVLSPYIYESEMPEISGKYRAEALMNFYKRQDIQAIFDVSGGDMANEVLPYLDFSVIAENDKPFFGYSDLTVILNAIYTKTGRASVLYQPSHLVWQEPLEAFVPHFYDVNWKRLDNIPADNISANNSPMDKPHLSNFPTGVVVGGNIRCFLKLAGTEFWPDLCGKLLLMESLGGKVPQMITYLSQLKLLGTFEKVRGILLGTFTEMEAAGCQPDIYKLVRSFAGPDMPIACTRQIGHAKDARAIKIGSMFLPKW